MFPFPCASTLQSLNIMTTLNWNRPSLWHYTIITELKILYPRRTMFWDTEFRTSTLELGETQSNQRKEGCTMVQIHCLRPITLLVSVFLSLCIFWGKWFPHCSSSEDNGKHTLILKQSLLLNTCPQVMKKALLETGIKVQGCLCILPVGLTR